MQCGIYLPLWAVGYTFFYRVMCSLIFRFIQKMYMLSLIYNIHVTIIDENFNDIFSIKP